VQNFKPQLNQLLQDSASITAEGAKYMLDISKEHREAFDVKLQDLASAAAWKADATVGLGIGEPFLSFRYSRDEESLMPAVAKTSVGGCAAAAVLDSEMVTSTDDGPNLLETMGGLRLAPTSEDN
jgi:hypothetical protein